jgi:hypothetical protein
MSLEPLGLPPSRQTRVLLPDDPETVAQLREQRDDARDMVAALEERIDRVLGLHMGGELGLCWICRTKVPCLTTRTLGRAE